MNEQRTSAFFDAYARDFDAIYGNRNTFVNRIVNRFLRKSMRLRYEKTIAGCDPIEGMSAIDIGCGPGHYAIELAQRGAGRVYGIDFAPAMIELAQRYAGQAGVGGRCEFADVDFLEGGMHEMFDYAIAMGFMDYMADPVAVVQRVLALTRRKAFFSFPAGSGFLAWQRKLRYRRRCDLYLYSEKQVRELFNGAKLESLSIEKIARDYFVTAVVG